ncbi:MAG: hypothetical protein H6705_04025 [Myxococcales bacterium]|nr:hypothetical protein [Myxococcales bacterium]
MRALVAFGVLLLVIGCDGAPDDHTVDGAGPDDGIGGSGGSGGSGGEGGIGGAGGTGGGPPPDCAAWDAFTAEIADPIAPLCAACHRLGGAAAGTRLVLPAAGADGFAPAAFAVYRRAHAILDRDGAGRSHLLLKPTAEVMHGGGRVLADARADAMRRFVDALDAAAATDACAPPTPTPDGLELLDGHGTLRKALLQLAGRPPTAEEIAAVDAADATGDPATLRDAIDAILVDAMREPAFERRLSEMFNDLLLTDTGRLEQSYGGLAGSSVPRDLRAAAQCESVNWQNYDERTGTPDARLCIEANEALAEEPLRLIAHVVREGRPFGEILTAEYRYLNAFAARLFGLDLAPFAGHEDDPEFYAEVRIPAMHGPAGLPEEYAGLLTTNAFLYRYGSSSTNRNRARAHHTLKLFRGIDVMKSAARLDLSQIDFAAFPWRNDPQCVGCHAAIDPIAGAFQHWTNCYDVADVRYYEERYCGGDWFGEHDMFPPGVGPGEADRLGPAALPTALQQLARATVARPDFARAIAAHVYLSLLGQAPIALPADGPPPPGLAAAQAAQEAAIDALGRGFHESGLDFTRLVLDVVATPAFRARSARGDDLTAATGLGGGGWVQPELLHRKVEALFGAPWASEGALAADAISRRDPPFPLLSLHRLRILAGGIDSRNLTRRVRVPGALPLAVAERLALEMSCRMTAWDFAQPAAARRLFVGVDAATPVDDPAAIEALRHLHAQFLGERLASDDPELAATHAVLVEVQRDIAEAIAAGDEPAALPPACRAELHYATGEMLPAERRIVDDPDGTLRAWQAVLVYLMSDHRFLFEP